MRSRPARRCSQPRLKLFTARGYAEVGTEEVVAAAKVTRGALYHHFTDKRDLFRAVHERVEQSLVEGIGGQMDGVSDPWEVLVTGTRAFLDACDDPAVKQIALIDAPAVLGWREWREVDERYGLGLMRRRSARRWKPALCARYRSTPSPT